MFSLVNQKAVILKKLQSLSKKENANSLPETLKPVKNQNTVSGITALRNIVEAGSDSLLNSEDPNQRIKGLIGIKKYIAKQIATKEPTSDKAHDLLDELSMLMRSILNDTSPEVYIEALKLLNFALSQLLKYLSPFDLQITVNTIISILIPKAIASPNHKIQIASDKFIISLGKDSLVGPIILIKNIFRLLDKLTSESAAYFRSLRMSSSQHGFASQGPASSSFDFNQNVGTAMRYFGLANVVLSHFKTTIAHSKEAVETFTETAINMWGIYAERVQIKEVLAQIAKDLKTIESKIFEAILARKDGDEKVKLNEILNANPDVCEEKLQSSPSKKFVKPKPVLKKSETTDSQSIFPSVQPASVRGGSATEELKVSKELPSYAKRMGKPLESSIRKSQPLPPLVTPDKLHSLPPLNLRRNPEELKKDRLQKPNWLVNQEEQANEKTFAQTKQNFETIKRRISQDVVDDPIKTQAMMSQPNRFPK